MKDLYIIRWAWESLENAVDASKDMPMSWIFHTKSAAINYGATANPNRYAFRVYKVLRGIGYLPVTEWRYK